MSYSNDWQTNDGPAAVGLRLGQQAREIAELRAAVERWKEAHHAQLAAYERCNESMLDLRAENEQLRAVAAATRTYVFGLPSSGSKYDAVITALAALDGPN